MPSNTLKHSSRSFSQVKFLPAKTRLMVLVKPSKDDNDKKLLSFLHTNLNTQYPKDKNKSFVELILQEDLIMNLHGVTQGKLQKCLCQIPALSKTTQSVNNAYTLISSAYEKNRSGPGGSVFIKVYFQDTDNFWKPLNVLRESLDKTYDSELKQAFRDTFTKLSKSDKVDVLANLLNWTAQDASGNIIDSLKRLDINNLQRLNTLVGLSHLQNVLTLWSNNQATNDEEFWQKTLTENSFVLSQIFAIPVILFKDKAYVGGKSLSNTGGKIVDLLYTSQLTKNTALIEIKTPVTKILGNPYRDEIYSASSEVSGALVQVTNYKNTLIRKFDSLIKPDEKNIEVFNPVCLLILGNAQRELTDVNRQRSFEMFRQNQREVQIITFDELFGKLKMLVDLIAGNSKAV